jgi:hypothetical protein
MQRQRPSLVLGVALLGLALAAPDPLRSQEEGISLRFKPAFHFEYFSRTIGWDADPISGEDLYSSKLQMPLGLFSLGIEFQEGFSIGLLAGYGFSNFNGLVFRQLPFSIDYEADSIGAFLIGAEINKTMLSSGFFEMGAVVRYVLYLGSTKNFTIDQLNENGTFDVKGTWMRLQAGPIFYYRGYENLSPFLSVTFDKLWGTFTMNETIKDLIGSEKKKISGKGIFGISLGTIFEPSAYLSLKVEGTIIPFYKGSGLGWGVDYGASLRAALSF